MFLKVCILLIVELLISLIILPFIAYFSNPETFLRDIGPFILVTLIQILFRFFLGNFYLSLMLIEYFTKLKLNTLFIVIINLCAFHITLFLLRLFSPLFKDFTKALIIPEISIIVSLGIFLSTFILIAFLKNEKHKIKK